MVPSSMHHSDDASMVIVDMCSEVNRFESAEILFEFDGMKETNGENASKEQLSVPISPTSSSDVSTISSMTNLLDYSAGQDSLENVKKELAFPTRKGEQMTGKRRNKASSEVYQPLADGYMSEERRKVEALRKVFETLEDELVPFDLRSSVNGKKPVVLVNVIATSSLLRARKFR